MLVGRQQEDATCSLATMSDSSRSPTGGTGKTRLSLQVAAELIDDFRDGVFFVELAPISDPSLVPTIAQSVGLGTLAAVRPSTRSSTTCATSASCWCWTISSRSWRRSPS